VVRGGAAVWAALAVVAGLVAVALAVRLQAPRHKMSMAAALASVLLGVILGGGACACGASSVAGRRCASSA